MSKLLVSLLCAFGSLSAVAAENFYITPGDSFSITFQASYVETPIDLYVAAVSPTGTVSSWERAFTSVGTITGGGLNGSPVKSNFKFGADISEIAFQFVVHDGANTYNFFSGGGLTNADGLEHTLTRNLSTGGVSVSFDDFSRLATVVSPFGDLRFIAGGVSSALSSPAPAVPEPETYAMLLAGLALTGAVARRRNRGNV